MIRKLVLSGMLSTVAVSAAAGTALAEGPRRGMGHYREGRPIFALLLLLFVAAVAILGTWMVLRRRPVVAVAGATSAPLIASAPPTASAESILAERLARGEISTEVYHSTLAALRSSPPAP